jgi:hypothetical protein
VVLQLFAAALKNVGFLCMLVSQAILPITEDPSTLTIYLSSNALAASDAAGCGLSLSTPCQSMSGALSQVPPSGATILIADGVYFGPRNGNLAFGLAPVRIASVNGPDTVRFDGELQRRIFNITLSSYAPAVVANSTIEGITFMRGRAMYGGAVLIRGNGFNTGNLFTFINCVFERNIGVPIPAVGGSLFSTPSAGAVGIYNAVIPGSKTSAQHAAFYPPNLPRSTSVPPSVNRAAPNPIVSPAWLVEPSSPTFVPAVHFLNCQASRT